VGDCEAGTRHKVTGLVSELDEGIARVFAHVLTEVRPGAKRRAYNPIPAEAIATAKHREPAQAPADSESEVVQ